MIGSDALPCFLASPLTASLRPRGRVEGASAPTSRSCRPRSSSRCRSPMQDADASCPCLGNSSRELLGLSGCPGPPASESIRFSFLGTKCPDAYFGRPAYLNPTVALCAPPYIPIFDVLCIRYSFFAVFYVYVLLCPAKSCVTFKLIIVLQARTTKTSM